MGEAQGLVAGGTLQEEVRGTVVARGLANAERNWVDRDAFERKYGACCARSRCRLEVVHRYRLGWPLKMSACELRVDAEGGMGGVGERLRVRMSTCWNPECRMVSSICRKVRMSSARPK